MPTASATLKFYQTTIGKKAIMAISGTALFGFVIAHMIGNLQVFAGPEKLNAYARFLHKNQGLLWTFRTVMLVAVFSHISAAVSLVLASRRARPQKYARQDYQAATAASRSMVWAGVALLAFVLYHLGHFTFGFTHHSWPAFVSSDVYCNVVTAFSVPWVVGVYIIAMVALGMHLYHGLWSICQTLGLNTPTWDARLRLIGQAATGLIVVGNIAMPLAVLTGIIPSAGICQ